MQKNILKLWFSIRYSYNQKWSKLNLANSKLKFTLFLMLITISSTNAQSNIDKTYEFFDSSNNVIDNIPKVDYSVCASNTNQTNYIAVTGFLNICEGISLSTLKLIEFDSTGSIINLKKICSPAILNIVPTDIKALTQNNGYLICGYIKPITDYPPRPFTMMVDNYFNVVSFKFYLIPGVFTRLVQQSDNRFSFVGFEGSSTQDTGYKNGIVVLTDDQFQIINSIKFVSPSTNYNIATIHDAVRFSNSEIVIAGTMMVFDINCTSTRIFVAKINPNSGTVIWQNSQIGDNLTSPIIDYIDTSLYLFANGRVGDISILTKYNILTGNLIGVMGVEFQATDDLCTGANRNYRVSLAQYINVLGRDSVFISGKIINPSDQEILSFDLDIHCPGSNSLTWYSTNQNTNTTTYSFSTPDAFGYKYSKQSTSCATSDLAPMYTSRNTLNIKNSYISVRHTHVDSGTNSNDQHKTWTFEHRNPAIYGHSELIVKDNVPSRLIQSNIYIPYANFVLMNENTYFDLETFFFDNIICNRRGFCCNSK